MKLPPLPPISSVPREYHNEVSAYAEAHCIACAHAALEEAAKEFDGLVPRPEPASIIRAIKIEGETP